MGTQSTWGSTIHTFAPISATLNRSASTFYTKQIPNTQPSQWHSQQATSARSFLPSSSHLLVSSLRQVLRPYRTKLLYTNKQTARLRCRSPHQHPVDDSWLYPWHHSRSLHHPQVLECARWLPSPDDLNTPLDEARLTQSSSPFIHSSAFSGLHFQRGSWHGMFGIGFWEGLRWRYLITAGRSEGAKQHWLRNLDVLDMDLFCGHDCIRMGAEHFCVSVLFGFEAAAVFFHIFSANISTECLVIGG